MIKESIALKVYGETVHLYVALCEKDCAMGSLTDDEYIKMIDLFMSTSLQARILMKDFYEHYTGGVTEDIDILIDFAAKHELIWYPTKWKIVYHGLRKRIEENRMVANDKWRNLHTPRYLLPTLYNQLSKRD